MADESPRPAQDELVVAPDHPAVPPDAPVAGGAEDPRPNEPTFDTFDAPPESSAAPHGGASYRLLALVTVLSAASDLVTKWWAKARLAGFESRGGGPKHLTVIPDHLDFIYAQNPGGAWSFLRGLPEYIRRPFFLFISAAAIVFIVSIYRRVRPDQTAMKWGLPLALGGAIGNLVDRIRYGYVIDFIDVYVSRGQSEHHWPTFNVADIWICVGVALMAIDMFAASRRARAQELALRGAETVAGEPPA